MRGLIQSCICAIPDSRPDAQYLYEVSDKMFQSFVDQNNISVDTVKSGDTVKNVDSNEVEKGETTQ